MDTGDGAGINRCVGEEIGLLNERSRVSQSLSSPEGQSSFAPTRTGVWAGHLQSYKEYNLASKDTATRFRWIKEINVS